MVIPFKTPGEIADALQRQLDWEKEYGFKRDTYAYDVLMTTLNHVVDTQFINVPQQSIYDYWRGYIRQFDLNIDEDITLYEQFWNYIIYYLCIFGQLK